MLRTTVLYSSTLKALDWPWMLQQLNQTASNLLLFVDTDIQTQAHVVEDYQIGRVPQGAEFDFVQVTVELLCGRDKQLVDWIAKRLFDTLRDELQPALAGRRLRLSLDVREIPNETYWQDWLGDG